MISSSVFKHENEKSFFNHVEPISADYRVWLNGGEIPVYTCRVSKNPINRSWPGHQRDLEQSELASFVNIVCDEAVQLEVAVNTTYEKVMVRPYSKGIVPTQANGKVSFCIQEEGQYVFACDDLHCSLYIFVSRPIHCPDPAAVTHYFGPGIHFPGKITLKDHESVYVDKDALVYGCLYAEDAQDIRVFGNGVFCDTKEARATRHCYENMDNGNLRFFDCRDVKIEGVGFRNSAAWCVSLFHCFDVELKNIKVFGQWRYNTDGVDIVNCQNIVLRDSFVHSFDDTISIKGIDRYIDTNNENILTENCVLWCDWGNTCELGLETACRAYKNITFRNCHILRGGNTALSIQNGDCAEVSDILYEDMHVEYNAYDQKPQIQKTEGETYQDTGEVMIPLLVGITNQQFRQMPFYQKAMEEWPKPDPMEFLEFGDTPRSIVHDAIFRNIHVYCDEALLENQDKYPMCIWVNSCVPGVEHYNITVSHVWVNGKRVQKDEIPIVVENSKEIVFE